LWFHEWQNPTQKITVAQPVQVGADRLFASIGYGLGSKLLKIDKNKDGQWSANATWGPLKSMGCKFTTPVLYKDHVYGLDEGVLACVKAETGEQLWRDGRYGHGQLLLWENLLIVLSETGDLVLVEANPTAHKELGIFHALDGQKTWNNFAISNGRAYVRNHEEMACYDLTKP
jgi:outer membrane protein assembly factor BamB